MLAAATVALVWANTPIAPTYDALRHLHLGPLTVEESAADGALTHFFHLAGLLVGKPIGVFAGACVTTRVTRASLTPELSWRDVAGVAVLAGVGFTVALLVAELSFSGKSADTAKTAVLLGSITAALLASLMLRRRTRAHAVG